jgi:hypothetical protein
MLIYHLKVTRQKYNENISISCDCIQAEFRKIMQRNIPYGFDFLQLLYEITDKWTGSKVRTLESQFFKFKRKSNGTKLDLIILKKIAFFWKPQNLLCVLYFIWDELYYFEIKVFTRKKKEKRCFGWLLSVGHSSMTEVFLHEVNCILLLVVLQILCYIRQQATLRKKWARNSEHENPDRNLHIYV